jgi:hypothetical protein
MGKEIRVEEIENARFVVRLVSPELPEFEEELKDTRESAKALAELITEVAERFESVTINIFPTQYHDVAVWIEGVKATKYDCDDTRLIAFRIGRKDFLYEWKGYGVLRTVTKDELKQKLMEKCRLPLP